MDSSNKYKNDDMDEIITDIDTTYIDDIGSIDMIEEINTDNKSIIHPNGYLKMVIGCMFSGKTTYIINECKKWKKLGKSPLVINYALDRRYTNEDKVMSHDNIGVDSMMMHELSFDTNIGTYDIILINEGQFFPNLKEKVKYLVDILKKIVILSGLDGDYLRNPLGDILDLIPDCDEIIKLKAYCSLCSNGTEGIFTWKTKDNQINKSVLIDIGTDKYIPLCRKHYNNERNKQELIEKKFNNQIQVSNVSCNY